MDGVQVDPNGVGRITGSLSVVVQNAITGDEQSVYSTDEVEFVPVRDDDGNRLAVFVVFVPKNGYQRGRRHRVPFDRVLSIVD